MITRDDIVVLYRTKILQDILTDGARDGRRLDPNVDRHLHDFGEAVIDEYVRGLTGLREARVKRKKT